jgi:hypothetical protein
MFTTNTNSDLIRGNTEGDGVYAERCCKLLPTKKDPKVF